MILDNRRLPDTEKKAQNKSSEGPDKNGVKTTSGHELTTELNDLVFDLVDIIHNMGLPPVKKAAK